MTLRQSLSTLTFTLAAAFAAQPLLAQGHGGGSHGGGSGGGSHGGGGGSHAVPRGSGGGGGSHPGYGGGGAEYRHPQAGTGYHYGYGHGYYPGYGHSHGYYPYYGYGYGYGYGYPYYSYPYYWPGVSLSFGWGYPSSEPQYVYGTPSYSVGASAPYAAGAEDERGAAPPPARETERSYTSRPPEGPSGRVRLEVRPEDTSVYLDDAFHGTASQARSLNLPPGHHQIELVRPGFATERREVTVVTGESQDVFVELLRP